MRRAPVRPLKVKVVAEPPPARTLKVVSEVVPAVIQCVALLVSISWPIPEGPGRHAQDAKALAVLS